MSEGEFALALVGMPVGLLIMLMFAGRLTERFGARQLLIAGLFAFICLMPLRLTRKLFFSSLCIWPLLVVRWRLWNCA